MGRSEVRFSNGGGPQLSDGARRALPHLAGGRVGRGAGDFVPGAVRDDRPPGTGRARPRAADGGHSDRRGRWRAARGSYRFASSGRRRRRRDTPSECLALNCGVLPKLLGADERVAIHTRTHPKRLILPAVTLVILGVVLGVGVALIPDGARPIGQLAVALVGLVLAIWLVVLPFLRWWTTTTVTNRRLITRWGILNKIGKDIPLMRITDVLYERSLMTACSVAALCSSRRQPRVARSSSTTYRTSSSCIWN